MSAYSIYSSKKGESQSKEKVEKEKNLKARLRNIRREEEREERELKEADKALKASYSPRIMITPQRAVQESSFTQLPPKVQAREPYLNPRTGKLGQDVSTCGTWLGTMMASFRYASDIGMEWLTTRQSQCGRCPSSTCLHGS